MTAAIDILSWLFLLMGSFFAVMGGVGLIRMPEFFSRMHGAGITDTLGASLIIVGLIIQSLHDGPNLVAVKLVLILFFSLVASPSSCHALARSAIVHGLKPVLDVEPKDGVEIKP
jgi:multicomponent Na+:H+ antiporter subunit G